MTILKMAVLVYVVPFLLVVVAVALMVLLKALTGL
jgi:positive regulator of sigma E activity